MILQPQIDLLRPQVIRPPSKLKPQLLEPFGSRWALQFTQSASFPRIDCGNDSSIHLNSVNGFTIGCWAKFAGLGAFDQLIIKGSQNFALPANYDFHLGKRSSDEILFRVSDGTNIIGEVVTISTPITSTLVWYFIAATWDGTIDANGIKIYVGLTLEAQGTATDTIANMSTSETLYLGSAPTINGFDGLLSNAFAYNRVLSTNELRMIAENPQSQIDMRDLAGWWRFQEGSGVVNGTQIRDWSNELNHGSMQAFSGNPWINAGIR